MEKDNISASYSDEATTEKAFADENDMRCHATGYYKCTGTPDQPWQDAYGNGKDCHEAGLNAVEPYNTLCARAGEGTAFFDQTPGSKNCFCD